MTGAAVVALTVCALAALNYREAIADWLSSARKEARTEIDEAARMINEASAYARDTKTGALREKAVAKLQDARGQYDRRDYRDARTSAMVAQNYAQTVIDVGRGESATSREVRFYGIEGEVRVKRAGAFNWEAATSRMLLRIGDQIKTGSRAGAQIIYFDGTITTMRPESLLEIKDLYEEPSTRERRVKEKLNWGEVETSTRRANVAGSFHEIQSESASAKSSDESEFRVAFDKSSQKGRISAYTGRVNVATSQSEVTMQSGETVAVEHGSLGSVEKLPPPPKLLLPQDQKIFASAGRPGASTTSTTLAWEAVPGATRYRLQLSEQSLFAGLLLDKSDVRTTTVELPGLPPKSYFWKVATVDAKGRTGPYSSPRKFRIATSGVHESQDKTPPELRVDDFIQNGPYVILNGKTEPEATLWVDGERINVDEEGAFYAVVRLKRDGTNVVRVMAQDPSGNETRKTMEAYLESY